MWRVAVITERAALTSPGESGRLIREIKHVLPRSVKYQKN